MVTFDYDFPIPDWAVILDGATAPAGVDSDCIHNMRWLVRQFAAAITARGAAHQARPPYRGVPRRPHHPPARRQTWDSLAAMAAADHGPEALIKAMRQCEDDQPSPCGKQHDDATAIHMTGLSATTQARRPRTEGH
jgi:hypothetical protein